MVILIAVLGLVVVNAMKHSVWATSTVAATVPIAMFVGLYMVYLRPGRIIEASAVGVILVLLAVIGGRYTGDLALGGSFDLDAPHLAIWIIAYGFVASVLPIWLLLAPRDYLSAYIKIGTIIALAIGIVALHPPTLMPALTRFIDGSGPIFGGKVFPFAFITVACGAISGFHSLIASGTNPKMLTRETDARMIGYGAMLMDSGKRRRNAASCRDGRRNLSPRTHRRRAVTRGRDSANLRWCDGRTCSGRGLVSLRDYVRSAVHPEHARRRHSSRALHAAGSGRESVAAASPP
jgi:hypothetical protein